MILSKLFLVSVTKKLDQLNETGITPEYGEQILTLSTCTGLARDNRLLVLAVKRGRLKNEAL